MNDNYEEASSVHTQHTTTFTTNFHIKPELLGQSALVIENFGELSRSANRARTLDLGKTCRETRRA